MERTRCNAKVKIYDSHTDTSVFNYPVFNPFGLETHRKTRMNFSKSSNPITRNDSLKRAKDKIYDIAFSNNWDLFITLTFNPRLINSFDPLDVNKAFKNWLHNMAKRYEMVYIAVPEYHKSKRIHLHLLARGQFRLINSGHKLKDGRVVYNLDNWKYGFTTAVFLDDNHEAVSRYITKYVTKDIGMVLPNLYYAGGKGLVREPETHFFNTDYKSFDGIEYKLPFSDFGKVKYRFDPLDGSIYDD